MKIDNLGFINATIGDFLRILDARADIAIFAETKTDKDGVKSHNMLAEQRVMDFLTDSDFMKKYDGYRVVGITYFIGTTNFLIEEA